MMRRDPGGACAGGFAATRRRRRPQAMQCRHEDEAKAALEISGVQQRLQSTPCAARSARSRAKSNDMPLLASRA